MRIAMYGHKRIPSREGGVEIVVEELATRMAQMGHQVTCYNRRGHHVSGSNHDEKTRNLYNGVSIKRVWTIPFKGMAAMTSSLSASILCAFGHYDIVHIHAEGPAATCIIPKLFRKKVVVTIHGLDWKRAKWGGFASKYIKWGEQQAVKHADKIIVLSKEMQEYFRKEYDRDTIYIPNGVSEATKRPANIIKNKWGLEKDSYILYLGRIVPEKGIQYLLEAWKDIQTDKKLVIAGGSSDTNDFFMELQNKSGDNVIFTGFQQGEALEELYSNAYLYCLPSDLEGMPLSLLEAMSYGNCCLTSNIPECVEVFENMAVSFQKGDVLDLKNKIITLLYDVEKVTWYKNNATDYILKKYNWDFSVEQTLNIYKNI